MKRISVEQVCYVRLGTRKIEEYARFATEILGLQRVSTAGGDVAFRSDQLHHRICLTEELPDRQCLGIELSDEAAIEPVKAALLAAGFPAREADESECRRRDVRQAIVTQDGSGNIIELVTRPARSGRRYFPSRDAGIEGFQGIGLRSTDIARDLMFWTEILNAKVSDRVGEVTYLQIDDRHHRIVLYPSDRGGVLDISFDVESLDCVMQSNYFLKERQIKVVHGPGREVASSQVYLRFQGPEGQVFSYVWGMNAIGGGHRSRQFSLKESCTWGSECTEIPELAAQHVV